MKLKFAFRTYDAYWKLNNKASSMMNNSLYVSALSVIVVSVLVVLFVTMKRIRKRNKRRRQERVVEKILIAQQRVVQGLPTRNEGNSRSSSSVNQSVTSDILSGKKVGKKDAHVAKKTPEQLRNLKHKQKKQNLQPHLSIRPAVKKNDKGIGADRRTKTKHAAVNRIGNIEDSEKEKKQNASRKSLWWFTVLEALADFYCSDLVSNKNQTVVTVLSIYALAKSVMSIKDVWQDNYDEHECGRMKRNPTQEDELKVSKQKKLTRVSAAVDIPAASRNGATATSCARNSSVEDLIATFEKPLRHDDDI